MKVVVAGAGYAGTVAANRLAKKVPGAEITVVNPRAEFVERVRLHQQLAGAGKAATPLSQMLRDGVASRQAVVEKIGDGHVVLGGGEVLDFDHLVLAVGSTLSPLPGTVAIGTWEGAEQARTALADLPAGGTVTVVGTGPTGIETAAEIAYARPDLTVRLVGERLAAGLSDGARRRVRAGLERLGVAVVEGTVAEVRPGEEERDAGAVLLRSGERLASDLTLWAVIGAEMVARYLLRGIGKAMVTGDHTLVNGGPALLMRLNGELDGLMTVRVEDGRITGLYYVRNPEKLTRVEAEVPLTLR